MLSDVTYPSLSGTRVFTDFVELPSQLYEHWQEQPQVLQQFARHYQTGEPLPDDLLQALPRRAQIQPGLCHRGVRLLGADRSRIPHPAGLGQPRRAGVRAGRAGEDRHARGNRAAAPADAVRPYLLRRSLCVGLLQLHVVGGDGRRRVRRLRGGRQHLRSRQSPSACTTTSIRPAARAIRKRPMSPSAAASRSPTRCCAAAACWKRQRRPEVSIMR